MARIAVQPEVVTERRGHFGIDDIRQGKGRSCVKHERLPSRRPGRKSKCRAGSRRRHLRYRATSSSPRGRVLPDKVCCKQLCVSNQREPNETFEVTSKTSVGVASVVTLKRTDITLHLSAVVQSLPSLHAELLRFEVRLAPSPVNKVLAERAEVLATRIRQVHQAGLDAQPEILTERSVHHGIDDSHQDMDASHMKLELLPCGLRAVSG